MFETNQSRKVYCTPSCQRKAVITRQRVSSQTDELEVDVDRVEDLDELLAERGLKRDDWVIVRAVVNRWEGFYRTDDGGHVKVPQRQLKVFLRPKLNLGELLRPADLPTPPRLPKTATTPRGETRLVFIYGDDQRPHHDERFEQLKLRWVQANQPDEIVDLGDGMDMPTISLHKVDPAMNWSVQECANSYATWLYQLRLAAPSAKVTVLADNHVTGRLRDYQLARAADLYGVHPADIAGLEPDVEALWSVRRLLRLDELGVTYIDPPGDTHYAESHVELVPGELVAIHGYRTGQRLGPKFIDDYGCSVVYGHQHGQDVHVTDQRRRGVGQRRRLFALAVGCGAVLQGGGGFAPGADWQNCALTISIFPDGGWTFDYMDYADGVLRWRDQRYCSE